MADKKRQTDSRQVASHRAAADAQEPSCEPVSPAVRVSRWTSNGLVTALVLLAGLGVGRQVMRWWRPLPQAPSPARAPASGGEPTLVSFGDRAWRLDVDTVQGPQQEIESQLAQLCGRVLADAAIPSGPVGEEERRLLTRLAEEEPLAVQSAGTPTRAEKKGGGREGSQAIYRLWKGYPMLVGVLDTRDDRSETRLEEKDNTRRVAVWAMAIPRQGDTWTLYAFRTAAGARQVSHGWQSVRVPEQARRTVALGTDDGGAVVAFSGKADTAGAWSAHFDVELPRHGFEAAGSWITQDGRWFRKYVHPQANGATHAEVSWRVADGRRAYGLISFSRITSPE